MEHMAGGDLYGYITKHGRFAEPDAKKLFRQMLSAVRYCHKHDIVHRDLKLENFLLNEKGFEFALSEMLFIPFEINQQTHLVS
jgi:serine/threonine protein kinase